MVKSQFDILPSIDFLFVLHLKKNFMISNQNIFKFPLRLSDSFLLIQTFSFFELKHFFSYLALQALWFLWCMNTKLTFLLILMQDKIMTHTHTYIHARTHTHAHIHTHTHMCARTHTHLHAHTHKITHRLTHTHTHTSSNTLSLFHIHKQT